MFSRYSFAFGGAIVAGVVGIFLAILILIGDDKPAWQPVSGVVQYTGTAMSRGTQWTIIKLDDGRLYTCTDPRCVLLAPSERVSLSCYRVSEEAAASSWMCRFVSSEDTVVYPTSDR